MKQSILALGICLAAQSSFGFELKETIIGERESTQAAALASHETACDNWKTAVSSQLTNSLAGTIECGEVDEIPGLKGKYQFTSIGSFNIQNSFVGFTQTEEVFSTFMPGTITEAPVADAWDHFIKRCEAFKVNATRGAQASVVYATCGIAGQSGIAGTQVLATGTVVFNRFPTKSILTEVIFGYSPNQNNVGLEQKSASKRYRETCDEIKERAYYLLGSDVLYVTCGTPARHNLQFGYSYEGNATIYLASNLGANAQSATVTGSVYDSKEAALESFERHRAQWHIDMRNALGSKLVFSTTGAVEVILTGNDHYIAQAVGTIYTR